MYPLFLKVLDSCDQDNSTCWRRAGMRSVGLRLSIHRTGFPGVSSAGRGGGAVSLYNRTVSVAASRLAAAAAATRFVGRFPAARSLKKDDDDDGCREVGLAGQGSAMETWKTLSRFSVPVTPATQNITCCGNRMTRCKVVVGISLIVNYIIICLVFSIKTHNFLAFALPLYFQMGSAPALAPLLSKIPEDALDYLPRAVIVTYRKGQVVYSEDRPRQAST
jgi:hypothetical protein